MIRALFLAVVFGGLPLLACAQQDADSLAAKRSITSMLQQTGRVTIAQDERLEALVTSVPKNYYAGMRRSADHSVYYTTGYRVRVFSGNNAKTLAYQIERELKDKMPDLHTYVVFKTPNWRLLVGDYRTSEEAIAALRDLKKKFPARGREMFVVKDEIELPYE